ncbi:MAG: hypothetical protein A3D92_14390 [Bacteroidetes bacterium RIFCSPHIGHO2_02_FULL_44_7]|nr:MAG: hypothetical protein A3D92_14390 [Bacteroidetes bacterium RIFCSPHIGHO2_02_FULL_44_7]
MKTTILFVGLILSASAFAQSTVQPSSTVTSDPSALFVAIQPEDGQAVVFATQAELDAKIDDKMDKIKQLILANKDNPSELEKLQKELWRFENAVVAPTKN